MALPSNDKIIGDLGHTADHNAIVDEIIFIKENYLTASGTTIQDYLRKDSASATYATKESPQLTGTPTAPTAASATNNTQIATTAFVRTAVSNLVSSAPETLDTLNELAAALGNDANFATTVTNSLSTKLDSGTASSTYLTKTDASNTYFPRSASGGLLTEEEAAAIYLPISASSTLSPIGYLTEASASAIYLNKVDASNTYLPISASTNYLFNSTASATYLRIDSASSLYLPISASSNYLFSSTASATYLRRDTASSLYLPISASSNYLFTSTASATYLRRDSASTLYLPISASSNYLFSNTASATYLRQDSASVIYASLISPAFSGIPTAPTAASSSNSTQIATTEFVKSAISNIIDFAPETLDTLNELAAAIADDPNFSTTITNSLSSKLDSATASSIYLSISSASATYIGKDDIIDCGGP